RTTQAPSTPPPATVFIPSSFFPDMNLKTSLAIACALAGNPAWGQTISFFRQFSAPSLQRATAVAANASGVYVIGNSPLLHGGSYQGSVRKYDSQANELWAREFSVPAPFGAQLIGAAADDAGVYVIGYLRAAQNGDTAGVVLRKYSAAGDELWTRQSDSRPLA